MRRGRLYLRGRIWWCWWYDAQNVRHTESTRCTDRQAAEAFLRERERDAVDPNRVAARDETLGTAIARLIERQRFARSKGTQHMHLVKAKRLIAFFGADMRLETFTTTHVVGYVNARIAVGRSRHTVSKELVTLRLALQLALEARRWNGNPRAVVPAYSARYVARADRWLTIDAIMALMRELPDDRAARVAFAAATGAEWSALERAQRDDLDTTKWMVRVRGSKRASRNRLVPLVLPEQRQLAKWALDHGGGEGAAFFSRWAYSNSHACLTRACVRAGVAHVSWHDLRRTCAQWLAQRGCTPDLIAGVLGNSPAMAAQVYARLDPVQLARRIATATGCSNSVADALPRAGFAAHAGQQDARKYGSNTVESDAAAGAAKSLEGNQIPLLLLRGAGKRKAKRTTRKRAVADT